MMTSADIRQQFLDFFVSKQHQIVPSAPIVIKDDPTLLFTNAGMNQFKEYFLGTKKPENSRIADTQKCLRVSGKHNDLEEVGVDTYHHTMFEMLGNWSFGDYFKAEAIAWSWELLAEVFKIDKSRLYVTVFQGDEKENLPKDEEAIAEWKKWISEDRILLGNKKDNFWEMGDTGPCGPCTEIHVDSRSDEERSLVDGKSLVNKDHPQVIEIWNNVFIQFNRLKDGSLEPLPAKHVDTGMGFERLVRVLQGKQSNYDTDVFTGTIKATEKITHKKYGYSDNEADIAFRVIADHIRAIAFTIADGQLPSNTGAGYVIRRILRRAVFNYYSYLEYPQPLLYQLMPVVAKQFENVFPELQSQLDFVSKVVKEEEETFLRTIDKGLKMLEAQFAVEISDVTDCGEEMIMKKTIDGDYAFILSDTHGFPLDLTQLIAKRNGYEVDAERFYKNMEVQRLRSRAATTLDTEDWIVLDDTSQNRFVGYDSLEVESKVTRYRKIKSKGKEAYQLVLNVTPFYAESGGQVGDTGILSFDGEQVAVLDTKKENNLIIHFVNQLPENIDSEVVARVDVSKRKHTEAHHSATHLLHSALRKVLGTHVAQKGSMVNNEHLRFDFSHFAKVTDEQIAEIERIVNEKIRENIPVVIKEMNKDEAVALGAMALFGEKYGDVVRVVVIDPGYSIELCGGTHVGSTGQLGFFKIKHESAVAAGVRRIEAVSGKAAEEFVVQAFTNLNGIRELLRNPKDLNKAVDHLQDENTLFKRRIEGLEAKLLTQKKQELLSNVQQVNSVQFIGEIVEVSSADALKKLCFELRSELNNYVIALATNIEGKPQVVILLDEEVSKRKNLEAPKIIKEQVAPLIKGGGGGQKTLATAGGQDAGNLQQVIDKVKSLL